MSNLWSVYYIMYMYIYNTYNIYNIHSIDYSSIVYTKSIYIHIFKKFGVEICLWEDLIQLLGNVSS